MEIAFNIVFQIFTLLDVEESWDAPSDEPPCGFDGSGCIDPPGKYCI